MAKIQQTWQRWIPGLFEKAVKRGETVESGAEVTKAALEFALALGVLAIPSAPVVTAGLSFVSIGRKGLELLHGRISQEFNVEEWVAIAFPLAYIQSFDSLVQRNEWLKQKIGAKISDGEEPPKLNQAGELELNNSQAKKALTDFPNSILGQALNQQLSTYLQQSGISQDITPLVTGWVAWDTYEHIKQLLAYEPEDVQQSLSKMITAAQEIRVNDKYVSIESYLKEQISPSTTDPILIERWKVVGEDFKISEIYVPLKVQFLDSNGKPKTDKSSVNLESWVKEQLNKAQKNLQVMFIQAGPGRGKSVFCKMFANWVRENLHPIWTPILIRLRDIDTFEPNIENTLRAAVRENFANRDDWLSDNNTRYIFILDGFDELRFQGRTAKGVEAFLQQVGNYQAQTGCKHRFLVTGRESALQGIENHIPSNLARVEIALMNDLLQKQWLEKWGNLVGQDKAEAFENFLAVDNCPKRVQELAQEPLLLYLLAAMHREKKLNSEMFRGYSGAQAKILIYQTTMDWVLMKQRLEQLNSTITEFDTEDLRLILAEAGLYVSQSGKELTSIKAIESRLKNDKIAREMLVKSQQKLGENPLKNALVGFLLRPAKSSESTEGVVEFIHKSFGELLCAQKIKESLKKWVKIDLESRRNKFVVDDDKLAEEIYDLFGYGGLTKEIVQYLMALLDSEKEFQYIKLFERLEDFYCDWCQGKFIDGAKTKIFPLIQMQKFQIQNITLGLREIDIYAGLNVIIFLLELHRYAQNKDNLKGNIVFYPCGKRDSDSFDEQRLLRIIGYSNSIALDTFSTTVGYFLSGANLDGANLLGANLLGANLDGANLLGANLLGANLDGANFDGANLSGANLLGANLDGANFDSAYLSRVYLDGANLSRANLSRANLDGANLDGANFDGAYLSRAYLDGAYLDGANLSGAYLNGAYLDGAYLDGANLSRANLARANLSGAYLLSANFDGANLNGANLDGAYLDGANLSRANLNGANLNGANLDGANLDGANFDGANLDGANLINITWDKHTNWNNVQGLDKARNVPEKLLSQFNSPAHPLPPRDTPPSA